jgi:hypothetical protein
MKTEYYYNNKGLQVENINPMIEYKIVAKKVVTENLVQFFIKRANGRLVDTRKLNDRELKNSNARFIRVDEKVFDKYYNYITLKTATPLNSIERML